MQGLTRDEIDRTTEVLRQFILKSVDCETEASIGTGNVEQIDVAAFCGFSPSDRSEHGQLRQPESLADLSDVGAIDRATIDHHYGIRVHLSILSAQPVVRDHRQI